jgi:hypothetical protein
MQTSHPRSNASQSIRMTGKGSVVPLGLELLTLADPSREKAVVVEADEQFEGLIASDLEFVGPASMDSAASELKHLSAPRSSHQSALPGVDPAQLPNFRRE